MKPLPKIIIPAAISISLLLCGCQKEGETPVEPPPPISEADAADVVGAAFAVNTLGVIAQISDAINWRKDSALASLWKDGRTSGPLGDTTFTRQGSSYNFTVTYTYQYYPSRDTFLFNYEMEGSYSTPRISGQDSLVGGIVLTDIRETSTPYTLNGNLSRWGVQTRADRSFTSILQGTLDDLVVRKGSGAILGRIESGSATLSLTIDISEDEAREFDITLTFLGGQTARLTVNEKNYFLDLITGNVTPP